MLVIVWKSRKNDVLCSLQINIVEGILKKFAKFKEMTPGVVAIIQYLTLKWRPIWFERTAQVLCDLHLHTDCQNTANGLKMLDFYCILYLILKICIALTVDG